MTKPRLHALLTLTALALLPLIACRPTTQEGATGDDDGRDGKTARAGSLSGRLTSAEDLSGSAVIWVEGALGAPVPKVDTVITHLAGGQFEPSVGIGFVGNDYVIRNEDDTLHTTHLYLHLAQQEEVSGRPLVNGATLYNIALPIQGMEVRRPIKPYHTFRDETGMIDVKCNPHPSEKAALLVFDHPFATVVAEGGSFSIPNIPPGTYPLWTWHDGEAKARRSVTLKDGAPLEIVVDLG